MNENERAAFAMQRSLQIQEQLAQEVQQARETIVLLTEVALERESRITMYQKALEAILGIAATSEDVSMDDDIMMIYRITRDALKGATDATE